MSSKQKQQPDELALLGVLADIRQKTGVGDKPMLSELADTLAGLIKRESVALPDDDLPQLRQTVRWWMSMDDEDCRDFERLPPFQQDHLKRMAYYAKRFLNVAGVSETEEQGRRGSDA